MRHVQYIVPFSLLFVFGGLLEAAAQEWTAEASMPTARSAPGAVSFSGRIYVVGGSAGAGVSLSVLEVYDPLTNSWTTHEPMPTARYGLGFVELGGLLYAIGGEIEGAGNTTADAVEVYDPATDAWSNRAPMQTERYDPAVGVVGGKIYACGGYQAGVADFSSVEEYDPPSDTWTYRQSMPTALHGNGATAVVNNLLFVISGTTSDAVATVQCFDPSANAWSLKAPIPTPRTGAAAGILNGEIHVAGGYSVVEGEQISLTNMEIYAPDTNSWRAGTSMPTGRIGCVGAVVADTYYVVGGAIAGTATQLSTVESYRADTTAPVIEQPADIEVGCSPNLLVAVAYSFTVTDDIDPDPVVTASPASGSGFPIGTTPVTVTATDASGNSSTRTFNVIRAALSFTGFLSPIGGADAGGGSFSSPIKAFKLNSTIPVKFTASCGGAAVVTGVHTLAVTKYSDVTTAGEPIDATPQDAASNGNQFTLSSTTWHFNLDTNGTGMTTGIWLLAATLSDGSSHSAWIQIK